MFIAPNIQAEVDFWEFTSTYPRPWRIQDPGAMYALALQEDQSRDEYWQMLAHVFTFRALLNVKTNYEIVAEFVTDACSGYASAELELVTRLITMKKTQSMIDAIIKFYSNVNNLELSLVSGGSIRNLHAHTVYSGVNRNTAWEFVCDLTMPLQRKHGLPASTADQLEWSYLSPPALFTFDEMGIKGPEQIQQRALRALRDKVPALTMADLTRLLSIYGQILKVRKSGLPVAEEGGFYIGQ